MSVRVDLLGDPVVRATGHEPASLGATLDDALLAVLAVQAGRASRAWLAGLFWPDAPAAKARANLRWRLHRVRARPYADVLTADRTAVHWPVACDAHEALRARDVGDHDRVLELVRGPFLGEVRFDGGAALDAWFRETRHACLRAWREAALRSADRARRDGRHDLAVATLARFLDHEPLDEGVLQAYLAAAAHEGRADEASRRFERFASRLRRELELEPQDATVRLAHHVDASNRRADPSAETDRAAPSSAPDAPRPSGPGTDGPAPDGPDLGGPDLGATDGHDGAHATAAPHVHADTAFVGREVELGRFAAWLFDGPERWLYVTGPGGIGKSRLVVEALRAAGPAVVGPTRFVRASDAGDARDLARAVTFALRPDASAAADPVAQARRVLADAGGVLVLDGLERHGTKLDWLHEAVAGAATLRLIATSRVRPRRSDVRVMALGGLKAPDPESVDPHGSYYRPRGAVVGFGPSDAGAPDDGAVRLFVAVADRVAGPFAPDPEARASVARICRLLDGVPLAIELAAAWIRTLDPHELEEELRRAGHELLRRGGGDDADRHGDLDHVFTASWALLPERARRTIETLSVFRGGFDRAAARAVTDAGLSDLAEAIDASLLDRRGDRFRLLEPARRFAERRLDRDPERATAARTAHLRWAAGLARDATSFLHGERARDAPSRLLPEVENLRAAWGHAVRTADAAALASLSPALSEAWDLQGRYREGAELFAAAEPVLRPKTSGATDPTAYAWARLRFAWFAFQAGRYDDARAPAHDATERFAALADSEEAGPRAREAQRGAGTAAYLLAVAAAATGDTPDARRWFHQALERHRAADDRTGVARAESGLGQLERTAGRPEAARDLLERSLRTREASGDDRGVVAVSGELASVQLVLGDVDGAERTVRRALHRARLHADAWGEATLLHHRAAVAAARGEGEVAERDYLRAIARLDRAGHRYAATLPREGLGDLWSATRPRQALRPWAEALRTALDIGATPRALSMLARLGEARAAEAPDQALVWLQVVIRHPAVAASARDRAGVAWVRIRSRMAPERFDAGVRRGARTPLEEAGEAAWRWARVTGGSAPSLAFDAR